jgi:hypothetical protein|tara:strand:- start:938 stop:1186 length:249 start_codon:yes stop_codon:yes gene_type:complete
MDLFNTLGTNLYPNGMIDRADSDESNPRCPWNQEEPELADYVVTMTVQVQAYDDEDACAAVRILLNKHYPTNNIDVEEAFRA